MEHSYFQDRLSAYHDNELPLQEKVVVEQHLRDCPECQEHLANYARLDQLVSDHSQLGDTDYWEKSARNIEKEIGLTDTSKAVSVPAARRNWALTWKLAAVAASVLIIGYLGFNRDQILPPERVIPSMSVPSAVHSNRTPSIAQASADSTRDLQTNVGTAAKNDDLAMQKEPPDQRVKGNVAMTPAALAESKSGEKQTTLDRTSAPAAELEKSESLSAPVAMAPALKASRQVERLAAPLQNSRESTAAVAVPANDSLSTISYWRSLKDSLIASSDEKGAPRLSAGKEPTSRYQTSEKKVQSSAAANGVESRDARLAEAWYQIARLTSSDSEKTVATNALKAIAGGASAVVREKAQTYLDSLGTK